MQLRQPQMRQPRPDGAAVAAPAPAMRIFATPIPTDVLPPLPAVAPPVADEYESTFDPTIWTTAASDDAEKVGRPMSGEPVMDDLAAWLVETELSTRAAATNGMGAHRPPAGLAAVATGSTGDEAEKPLPDVVAGPAPWADGANTGSSVSALVAADTDPAGEATGTAMGDIPADPFAATWEAVRDANIRPYVEWRTAEVISLPVITRPPSPPGQGARPAHPGYGGGNGQRGRPDNGQGGGGGSNGHGGRRRRGGGGQKFRDRGDRGGNERGGDRGDRNERGDRNRDRDRGPRLPGFYNPGGD